MLVLYFLIAAVCCAADQLLKKWVAAHIALGGARRLLPGVLHLTHVRNTGMAFSLLSEHTWILAVVSALVAAVLVWCLLKGKFTPWEKAMLALILGGALGNLIDRVFLGYVVDMFETEFVRFAVFNLADTFIDVGAAVFCVLYIVRTLREDRAKRHSREEHREDDADSH